MFVSNSQNLISSTFLAYLGTADKVMCQVQSTEKRNRLGQKLIFKEKKNEKNKWINKNLDTHDTYLCWETLEVNYYNLLIGSLPKKKKSTLPKPIVFFNISGHYQHFVTKVMTSFCFYLFFYSFIYLFICVFVYSFIYIFVCLFIHSYIYLCICLFIYIYICVFVYSFIYICVFVYSFIYIYLCVCLFIYIYICVFVYSFIYIFVCLFIHL